MTSIIKPQEFAGRRQQLMEAMGKNAIAIIASAPEYIRNGDGHFPFHQDSDFYYLTGFSEPEAIAVLAPGRAAGEYILFNRPSDPLKEAWNGKRAGQTGACVEFGANQSFPIEEFTQRLLELLNGRQNVYFLIGRQPKLDNLIMDAVNTLRDRARAGAVAPTEFVNLDHWLYEKRLIKSNAEIEVMRKAANISAQAHIRAMKNCKPGIFEYQIEGELLHEYYRHGSRVVAYESIVAGGANSCILHYHENSEVLKNGELLLIDAGCEYQNYASDITRTFPVSGRFTPEQKAIYKIVLAAQLTVIENIKPGLPWNRINEIANRAITKGLIELGLLKGDIEQLIKEKAYSKFYMHSTTHWLGLDTHDVGGYKQNGNWRELKAGMVLTVEPGIYIAAGTPDVDKKWWNIGVRIEDDVLVTKNGCDVLSAAVPKGVAEIEALVGSGE